MKTYLVVAAIKKSQRKVIPNDQFGHNFLHKDGHYFCSECGIIDEEFSVSPEVNKLLCKKRWPKISNPELSDRVRPSFLK